MVIGTMLPSHTLVRRAALGSVPSPTGRRAYHTEEVEQLNICNGWHFKWGSTGLCPIGNGRWYISENSRKDGVEICDARMYTLSENGDSPFIPYLSE